MTNVAETPSGNTQVILIACQSLISPFYHLLCFSTKYGFQAITLKPLFDGIISNSLHNHSDTQV